MINISHLSKTYNGKKVLNDVSLHIGRNEVVSIIGYSGSGKSTLIKCIAGLKPYDSGSLEVNINKTNGYGGIGMVFDSYNLFPHLTILQNLILAPMKVLGLSRKQAEEEALLLLEKVGIWATKDSYPNTLSSGQCQRAAIARSLMMKPEILLLDEPTSSLDPVSTSEVIKVLADLKNQDRTIVVVTHKISLARSISDNIIFISDGVICEQGTPSEIINNPQHRETKEFINHSVNLVYKIHSAKYDLPELNAKIEGFSMRYRLSFSDTYCLQLAVEELLNLIPLDNGLNLVVKKSDTGLEVEAMLAAGKSSYLSNESIKEELGYTILEGLCEKIDEYSNELGATVIKLTIKQNTI